MKIHGPECHGPLAECRCGGLPATAHSPPDPDPRVGGKLKLSEGVTVMLESGHSGDLVPMPSLYEDALRLYRDSFGLKFTGEVEAKLSEALALAAHAATTDPRARLLAMAIRCEQETTRLHDFPWRIRDLCRLMGDPDPGAEPGRPIMVPLVGLGGIETVIAGVEARARLAELKAQLKILVDFVSARCTGHAEYAEDSEALDALKILVGEKPFDQVKIPGLESLREI